MPLQNQPRPQILRPLLGTKLAFRASSSPTGRGLAREGEAMREPARRPAAATREIGEVDVLRQPLQPFHQVGEAFPSHLPSRHADGVAKPRHRHGRGKSTQSCPNHRVKRISLPIRGCIAKSSCKTLISERTVRSVGFGTDATNCHTCHLNGVTGQSAYTTHCQT